MARHVALLRAVNLGARNRVGMARLRELMEELGYEDVTTHGQSGNVVFSGPQRPAEEVERRLGRAYEEEFGFEVPVIVRSRRDLAALIAARPLAGEATDPGKLFVVFLERTPPRAPLGGAGSRDFAPEVFEFRGRHLILWAPDGVRQSAVAKALAKHGDGGAATMRTWKVVEKLAELAGEA